MAMGISSHWGDGWDDYITIKKGYSGDGDTGSGYYGLKQINKNHETS